MALVFENSVLQKLFGDSFSQWATLPIDVTLEEQELNTIQVTNRPVQSGAVISDNIIIQPKRFVIEGIFGNDNLYDSAERFISSGGAGNNKSWQDKKAVIDELIRAREPFDIVTNFGIYPNCFFLDFSPVSNREFSNALRFTATLQQIPFIESETTEIPKSAQKDPAQTAPAQDRGKVQKTEQSSSSDSSILSGILGVGR